MWWLLIVLAATVLGVLAVQLGFLPPPHAKILIRIHSGQLRINRGQLRAQPREFVAEILHQARVMNGFIAITQSKHVAFSRNIPRDIQQRIRNVLLND